MYKGCSALLSLHIKRRIARVNLFVREEHKTHFLRNARISSAWRPELCKKYPTPSVILQGGLTCTLAGHSLRVPYACTLRPWYQGSPRWCIRTV